ncbi:hypothetical protein cypCar_00000197 [Cyprinus carpio]|nr:hypothetical protein cypCar_00000197 [Cyprinus carpio]
MVRARRIVKKPRAKKQQEYDSDDPEAYGNEAIPDKKSSKYVEDKIDEFHNEKISKLLALGIQEDSDQEDEDKVEFAAVAEEEKDVEKEERIVKDLKTMSQKEKLKLLKKESPELLELIQDFKAKVSEKARPEEAEESESDEEANLRFYNAMAERQKLKRKKNEMQNEDSLVEEEKMEGDAKRRITYQNKGLTPKRKKIDRNPRVKHREKFRRAQVRRKGQVREVRREETRYSGEWSGIRAGVKRSVKLK